MGKIVVVLIFLGVVCERAAFVGVIAVGVVCVYG